MDIVHTRQETQLERRFAVFHLVNPTTTSWDSLLEPITAVCGCGSVEMVQWIEELKQIENPTPQDLTDKPALKLLGFYQSLVEGEGALSAPIDIRNTKAASATMRSLSPITPDMMVNWLKQWNF